MVIEAVDALTVEDVEVMMVVDDREAEIKVVVVEAVETFPNEMVTGHAVDVQIKISHGETNAIGEWWCDEVNYCYLYSMNIFSIPSGELIH